MDSVIVCRDCGKTVERNFNFCPWCGCSLMPEEDISSAVQDACLRMDELRRSRNVSRIDVLDRKLIDLEKILSQLASLQTLHN
ncbi:zinc ribbon domain-containing protein [Treponema zuelzerae]|uniref:Zinc ribbon domain-containing protein n=1 Tax=Teretinema zuelzerae TaxID=156 RepID=A0AAE3EF65_9SPIR|nr:zinc ribbon domain-containing protein [Teretinema zuelzerae]MBN2811399.1 hypothetical protein [Spirochaetales bacterium]MCD1653454.1 zinc ribbon domain-containing protein [Teretinema zuelzerae]HPO02497.1 zinc ribbon domain-containing protein [Treponemataceae bacterium]